MSLKFEYATDESELDRFASSESPEPPLTKPFPSEPFLREYDSAYDTIFSALSPFGCVESGGSRRGPLAMCRHVDPTRHITVVVRAPSPDLARAVVAVQTALSSLPERYSVRFDDFPTCVCVSREGRVLGHAAKGKEDSLLPYGFP